jgi:hypothetical protein
MTTTQLTTTKQDTFLSEIFPLQIKQPNQIKYIAFRLSSEIDKETANKLSYRFSKLLPQVMVTWVHNAFYAIAHLEEDLPSHEEWKEALRHIQETVEEFRHNYWSFQWMPEAELTPLVIANLAYQILRIDRPFSYRNNSQKIGDVIIRKEARIYAEVFKLRSEGEIDSREIKPAITLTLKCTLTYKYTLDVYVEKNPYRNNLEKLLIGLKVKDEEKDSQGTIVGLGGLVGENRERLLALADGAVSKNALIEAPDEQRLVQVKFGKNKQTFEYAMLALRPVCDADNAKKLNVDYGKLLKCTKLSYQERKTLLVEYKQKANQALNSYGLELSTNISSRQYNSLFYTPQVSLKNTPLLFGNNVKETKILMGLIKGGIYQKHQDFYNNKTIDIAVLKISSDLMINDFLKQIQSQLSRYKFKCNFVDRVSFNLENLKASQVTVEVEKKVNDLILLEPDIVLIILPKSDRQKDEEKSGSLYHQIYAQLLKRRITSQFIYEDTLEKTEYKYILNQVIPGILAKLGNLPFVLAEELNIADMFLGFDIARDTLKKRQGSLNACASIRLYSKRGEFAGYQLETDFIEGEEIPRRLLERLLPAERLANKIILIYRDGLFRGEEVQNLLARAEAIASEFILVECIKSGNPRLYTLTEDQQLTAPPQGLALKISPKEAILVTTEVYPNMGVPNPLRLKIHPQGKQVKIEDVVDTTLKLTLLHYGSLKSPRLPLPLYGADKMAYLRLQGIYPSILEDDRQFWL